VWQEKSVNVTLFSEATKAQTGCSRYWTSGYRWVGMTNWVWRIKRAEGHIPAVDLEMSYTNWKSGQPDNDNIVAMAMFESDDCKWNDWPVQMAYCGVCELDFS